MPTTVAGGLPVFSDASGHGNQSHLVYAANQQRWWVFVIKSKTATAVSSYVSSSGDLATATWSAGTDSPAFAGSVAMTANDQRNMGVLSITNGTTDAVHVSVGVAPASVNTAANRQEMRATFTGASSITWGTWSNTTSAATNASAWSAVKGNALGASTPAKSVHRAEVCLSTGQKAGAAASTNPDSGATWTAGFASSVNIDTSMANPVNSYAVAPLASDNMLCVYEDGGAAEPNCTGLRYNKSATTTWPATGSASVGTGVTAQDANDWCLCAVDTAHVYAFRRSGASSFDWRVYGGTAWSTPTNGVPAQNHLAGSGLFAATDGASLWLFVIDSATNGPVQCCKCSGASGATPSWGAWTLMAAAGSTARNCVSGFPAVANGQIGVVWTAVNGANFDLVVGSLGASGASADAADAPSTADSAARAFAGARAPADAPATADSAARLFAGARAASDAPATAGGLVRGLLLSRSAQDSPATSDGPARALAGPRAAPDAPHTADSASRAKAGVASAADGPQTADAGTRRFVGGRAAADASATAEAASGFKGKVVGAADAPHTAETAARTATAGRAAADAPATADAGARAFAGARAVIDSPALADAPGRVVIWGRAGSDAPHTADAAAAASGRTFTAADSPASWAAGARSLSGARGAADTPSLSDFLSRAVTWVRAAADFPVTSEAAAGAVRPPAVPLPDVVEFLTGAADLADFGLLTADAADFAMAAGDGADFATAAGDVADLTARPLDRTDF
jgi:hypothetical protein